MSRHMILRFSGRILSVGFLPALLLTSLLVPSCSDDSPTKPKYVQNEALDLILEEALEENSTKGVSAAVAFSDGSIWIGAAGESHEDVSIAPGMLFSIWSTTKSFTGALILRLAEEGLLGLDDPVGEWLPPYEHIDSLITVRQLLNHTSGVFDFVEHPDIGAAIAADPTRRVTAGEMISMFVLEPYFAPGAGWKYSNTNYLLLGMIATEATGSTISAEFRSRFWEPLEMNDTFLMVEEDVVGVVAHGWSIRPPGDTLQDISSEPTTARYSGSWTAGAVRSTAEDMVKWCGALFHGQVLSSESLQEMMTLHQPTSGSPEDVVDGYGLGLHGYGSLYTGGETAIGHAGGADGYISAMAYFQDYDASVVILINQEGALGALIDVLSGIAATLSAGGVL